MKTIYLIRHTEYELFHGLAINPGRLPVELSAEGVKQAQRLHVYFADKQIDKIFSSPVHRCVRTSEIISARQIPLETDIRLAEIFSAAQGSIVAENWRRQLYEYVDSLGGESPEDIMGRMQSFWQEVVEPLPDGNYIVCSHGDPLLFLYDYLKGLPAWSDVSVDKPEGYVPRGSVRMVEQSESGWDVGEAVLNEQLIIIAKGDQPLAE